MSEEALDRAILAVATGVEVAAVAILVLGAVAATALLLRDWRRGGMRFSDAYAAYRKNLVRAILLGLEFLVIADIVGTVAVTPSFRNLGVLGVIVLIRTFLSFSLEIEVEGRPPWRRAAAEGDARRQTGSPA